MSFTASLKLMLIMGSEQYRRIFSSHLDGVTALIDRKINDIENEGLKVKVGGND